MIAELCSTTDVRDKDNMTPLHYACLVGRKDVVQHLLEEGKTDVGEINFIVLLICLLLPSCY